MLHVGDLVGEELDYGLVASHFTKLAHYKEKGFDLGGDMENILKGRGEVIILKSTPSKRKEEETSNGIKKKEACTATEKFGKPEYVNKQPSTPKG